MNIKRKKGGGAPYGLCNTPGAKKGGSTGTSSCFSTKIPLSVFLVSLHVDFLIFSFSFSFSAAILPFRHGVGMDRGGL